VDYRKIEAALAVALEEVEDPEEPVLTVFIHTAHAPSGTETDFLERLGVKSVSTGRQIFTATLSPRLVAELSDQPWVNHLRLSRKLRLLQERRS
jgi:hypothetical protein